MRFYTVLASRPVYYDRNPTTKVSAYSAATIAPHSATTRWTYTVPAARKAFVEGVDAIDMVDGAVGVAGLTQAAIQVTPSGGAATTMMNAVLMGGGVNTFVNLNQSSLGLLNPGDALSSFTADASSGGTHFFLLTAKYIEFDA